MRCADSMAICARLGSGAPASTAQDCAMESILASEFTCDPRGVPSSKKPRKYHSPSHADFEIAEVNSRACLRHVWRSCSEMRFPATSEKATKVLERNQASHTLSPLPSTPTLFIPSFQSPSPNRGRSCEPNRQPRCSALLQCSHKGAE